MVECGLGLPNRQWEPWTPAEIAALFDLAPAALLVLAYDPSTVAAAEQRAVLADYYATHPGTRVLVRPYEPDIPRRDAQFWAEECARRAESFGLPVEVICDNERNLECECGSEDWPAHVVWLRRWADAFRRRSAFPRHLGALSPCGQYLAGLGYYYAAGIADSFEVVDVHCYPGCLDDYAIAAQLFGKPVSITEYNQVDPSDYLAHVGHGARDAHWFILSGTEDQRPYWLLGSPWYESFRAAARAEDEGLRLSEQYPNEFRAWEQAGGVENHFRAHLLGMQVIQPTRDDLKTLIGNVAASAKQLETVYGQLPN